jgi:outer membrane protein OmpA-like peptidoglycan-associated protein
MMRSGRRWLLAFPVALLLGPVTLPFAKGTVDGALTDRAQAALADRGLSRVRASSDWAGLRLTGPDEARADALAAVAVMADADAVRQVTYVVPADSGTSAGTGASATNGVSATNGSPTAGQSPSPSPSQVEPTVEVSVLVRASGVGPKRTIALSGTVAGPQQQAALLDTVRASAGKALIRDDVLVGVGAPTPAVDVAFPAYVRVARQLVRSFTTGTARLDEQGVTVDGLASSEGAVAGLAGIVSTARANGIRVASTARGPVAVARERLGRIKGLRGVAFAPGSERLTDASKATLTRTAAILRISPGVTVRINGHTDNAGPTVLNRALSTRRAAAVKAFLVSKGVPAKRLVAQGFGEARPVRSNSTPAGRAANRRIEFVVQGS